jgi:hypothetical protein
VIGKTLSELFTKYKKFVDAEEWTDSVGKLKKVQLFPFFDCCREIKKTKGRTFEVDPSKKVENSGSTCTFFAKRDGELANAGNKNDYLSPTT